jgi:hypothetical protein
MENENYELTAQKKLFAATGLKEGDRVIDKYDGVCGILYISSIGYACVRMGEGRAAIWNKDFVKDE